MHTRYQIDKDTVTRIIANGVGLGLLAFAIVLGVGTTLFSGAVKLTANTAGWGLDNSDQDGWHRSGLQVHTDYLTGVQYVSTPGGGVHVRVDTNGRPIIAKP